MIIRNNDGINVMPSCNEMDEQFLKNKKILTNYSLRDWEGTTTLSITSRTSVVSSHQNKWPKIFLALTESPRPCHLRTHGAMAESVADVAESEQENGLQWTKLFVQL